MSAPLIAIRPDGSGRRIDAGSQHLHGYEAMTSALGQLEAAGLGGTTGDARAHALQIFSERANDSLSKERKTEIRRERWATRDAQRQAAIWMLTNGYLRHSPSAVRDAVHLAGRWCNGLSEHGKVTDAAFNPGVGGAVFPGLIGQMLTETTPLPPSSFERIFPRVVPESLMPGMTQYRAIRRTAVGNPAVGSAIAEKNIPILRVGPEHELRDTVWMVLACEQSFVASLQANLPGNPVVGMSETQQLARLSMDFAANKFNWYGEPAANIPGILNDDAVTRSMIPESEATLESSTETVINAIVNHIATAIASAGGLMKPNIAVFSEALVVKLCKALANTTGITAVSAIEFLQTSSLAKIFPGIRFEVAAELNHIDLDNTPLTDSGVHGILLTRSDEYGIKRVPILGTTVLPVVEGGVIQTAFMVAQHGRPWASGLGYNYLITIKAAP